MNELSLEEMVTLARIDEMDEPSSEETDIHYEGATLVDCN